MGYDRGSHVRGSQGSNYGRSVAKRRKKAKSRIVGSLKKVAEHYGVQPSTVKNDWRHQGMPGEPRNWDLDAIDRWRSTRQSQKDRSGKLRPDGKSINDQNGETSNVQLEMEFAKTRSALADARKKDADARIKEIQAAKRRTSAWSTWTSWKNFSPTCLPTHATRF